MADEDGVNQGLGKNALVRSQCESHNMMFVHNFAYFAFLAAKKQETASKTVPEPYHHIISRFSMGAAMTVCPDWLFISLTIIG